MNHGNGRLGGALALSVLTLVLSGATSHAADHCAAVGKARAVVTLRQPESGDIAGVSLVVDYPKDRVAIPGEREDDSVKKRVRDLPTGFLSAVNDGDGEIRVSLASGSETFVPNAHFSIEFDRCDGGGAVAASDFRCKVESASLSCGSAIDDVTCIVSLE